MVRRFVVILLALTPLGCVISNSNVPASVCGDGGQDAGEAADAGVTRQPASGDSDTGESDNGCEDGYQPDGDYCYRWDPVGAPQRCLEGEPVLRWAMPWDERRFAAIACVGEAPQVYLPVDARWHRMVVTLTAPEAFEGSLPILELGGVHAAAEWPDGSRVALGGSLWSEPLETWLQASGDSPWRRSIDAPWMFPYGALTLSPDAVLFAGDDSFVLTRHAR